MKKKLLTAAIAAAVALPMAAQAGVSIYGKVHVSLDWVESTVQSYFFDENGILDFTGRKDSTWLLESGAGFRDSRIGFKGSEDLGNGLKAIWKMEVAANLDNSGELFQSGRNAYIGLASDWGTFLGGRHDTPMKISTGKLDYFADTLADYNDTLGIQDIRAPNVVAYISPNMNGLTFAIAGHTSERSDDADISNGWSTALMYSNNGLFAAVAYEDLGDSAFCIDPPSCDNLSGGPISGIAKTKWRVGLGWEGNNFGVAGVYEDRQDVGGEFFEGVGLDRDGKSYQISGKYMFGNNTVKGMWGQVDDDVLADKRDSWAIGWDYSLSKRTMAYMLYADSEYGLRGSTTKPDLSIDLAADPADITFQDKAKGFSIGMIHTF
jgi:predicted porin